MDTKNEDGFICSAAPWLTVRDGARAVAFYQSAFGAIEVYHVEDPTGAVVSRLSVAGADFWLSGGSPEDGSFPPESRSDGSVRMLLTVPDPDATFSQALSAGAEEVYGMSEGHGWRVGRLTDPFGHDWEITRPLSEP